MDVDSVDNNLLSLLEDFRMHEKQIAICMTVSVEDVLSWMAGECPSADNRKKLMHLVEFFRERYPSN